MIGDWSSDWWGRFQYRTGYEDTGVCWWCGGTFPDKRRRRFCKPSCSDEYYAQFMWSAAVRLAKSKAGNNCQECGGCDRLVVHHKDPLNGEYRAINEKNRPDNLVVLCHDCHWAKHRGQSQGRKDKDTWEEALRIGQAVMNLMEA